MSLDSTQWESKRHYSYYSTLIKLVFNEDDWVFVFCFSGRGDPASLI